jgi:hypothetical protein
VRAAVVPELLPAEALGGLSPQHTEGMMVLTLGEIALSSRYLSTCYGALLQSLSVHAHAEAYIQFLPLRAASPDAAPPPPPAGLVVPAPGAFGKVRSGSWAVAAALRPKDMHEQGGLPVRNGVLGGATAHGGAPAPRTHDPVVSVAARCGSTQTTCHWRTQRSLRTAACRARRVTTAGAAAVPQVRARGGRPRPGAGAATRTRSKALGLASLCWTARSKTGAFDSQHVAGSCAADLPLARPPSARSELIGGQQPRVLVSYPYVPLLKIRSLVGLTQRQVSYEPAVPGTVKLHQSVGTESVMAWFSAWQVRPYSSLCSSPAVSGLSL